MQTMARESWTDERLDDLKKGVDDGFRRVDERFAQVDQRLAHMDARFDALQRQMVQGFLGLASMMLVGFAAVIAQL